jgi:hypothetical protein
LNAGLIPPRVMAYATDCARRERLPVATVLRRMISLSVAADMAEGLTVRGERVRASRNEQRAA